MKRHLRIHGIARDRLPDGRAKRQILRAIDQARTCIPLRALLWILRLSASLLSYYQRATSIAPPIWDVSGNTLFGICSVATRSRCAL
jgi:hypothetical protein